MKPMGWPAVMLSAALLLLALPVPAQLPTLGDHSDMSLSAERKLGDRIAREIYHDPDYVNDPVLSEYLQGIWAPLLAAAQLRGELTPEMAERYAWVTLLIRDRSVNAFALPGGYMGVHLGLMGLVASRDELASVLAHEISHVTQRHISRLSTQQARNMPWIIGAMVLGALAASKSPNAAGAPNHRRPGGGHTEPAEFFPGHGARGRPHWLQRHDTSGLPATRFCEHV
jgi:predicted Zn-dependent protease